mmetsp:Transcript_49102/g.140125  ORF Transcript_49102/g.140125 Transcript_49102/m.140125 type:complete len:670 (+) Transcript_49102:1-2010(+)
MGPPGSEDAGLKEDQRAIQYALRQCGKGSILRGWRKELDPDGSFDCTFLQFCRATRRLELPSVDIQRLFGADSPDSLTLEEVAPEMGRLVRSFRNWLNSRFGGPDGMLEAFEESRGDNADGTLRRVDFCGGCRQHGFKCKGAHLEELFCLLDVSDCGVLICEDLMFLDLDKQKRMDAIQRRRHVEEVQHLKQITAMAREEMGCKLPPMHRRAPREWHKAIYEQLPEMAQEKQKRRRDDLHRRSLEARAIFMENLVQTSGDPIRAFRVALDPDDRYKVTKVTVAKYCQQRRLKPAISDLWRALDLDRDGLIQLQDVGPQQAAALASLKAWASQLEGYGKVAAIWGCAEADRAREALRSKGKWKSDRNMPLKTFVQVLAALGWPWLARGQADGDPLVVLKGLDRYGCGFVSLEDLNWLDKWAAPTWLSASPDPQAWSQLKAELLRVHKEPLRAWRASMDLHDTNIVTFRDFSHACKKVKFKGNVDGAWRQLDTSCSGVITLDRFDPPCGELLGSFKHWVELNFGGLEIAFRYMDTDGSGLVSFSELKRQCSKHEWDGDVKLLFYCLQVDRSSGKRHLSPQDVMFLDTWSPREEVEEMMVGPTMSRKPSMYVASKSPSLHPRRARIRQSDGVLDAGEERADSERRSPALPRKGMTHVKSCPHELPSVVPDLR